LQILGAIYPEGLRSSELDQKEVQNYLTWCRGSCRGSWSNCRRPSRIKTSSTGGKLKLKC